VDEVIIVVVSGERSWRRPWKSAVQRMLSAS